MRIQQFSRLLATFAVLIGLIFLSACHCDKTKLLNTWVLEKYGPTSALKPVLAQSEVVLKMDNTDHFSGKDGCNQVFGSYKPGGQCHIQFDSIKSTLIFCAGDGIMQQADAVNGLLRKVNSFSVTDTRLELCAPGNEVLQYRKQ